MRVKFRWTSAIALVGTVFTTIVAVHGSGAAAEVGVPKIVLSDNSNNSNTARFIANPVVQPLPADDVPGESQKARLAAVSASSLDELVAAQSTSGPLDSQLHCLAGAIYFEARGESLAGQLAVGQVVVNRSTSGRFPDSYCGVVYQRDQFSFVRGRSMPAIRKSSEEWREAIAIAQIAHQGAWESPVTDALYFHATSVAPRWRLKRLARIDNHIFYR